MQHEAVEPRNVTVRTCLIARQTPFLRVTDHPMLAVGNMAITQFYITTAF
jgi:hypothetical protein